jgi:hypothetical protein
LDVSWTAPAFSVAAGITSTPLLNERAAAHGDVAQTFHPHYKSARSDASAGDGGAKEETAAG